METFSKSEINRIMRFVAGKLNKTQKIIVCEVNGHFTSATAFVNRIAEKHSISKTAIWHSFRTLRKDQIIISNEKPELTSFGEKIKEVIK